MLYVECKRVSREKVQEKVTDEPKYVDHVLTYMQPIDERYSIVLDPRSNVVELGHVVSHGWGAGYGYHTLFKGNTIEEAKEYYEWFINKLLTQKEGVIRLGDYEKEKAAKHPNTGKCSNVIDMRLSPSSPEEMANAYNVINDMMTKNGIYHQVMGVNEAITK